LRRLALLTEDERRIVELTERKLTRRHPPRARLTLEQANLSAPLFVVSGWACRLRELSDGRRQIYDYLVPGDAIGLSGWPRSLVAATVIALTNVKVVEAPEIEQAWLRRDRHPRLATALDLAAAEEQHFLQQQIMRLGRQTAYERIAHLLLELNFRLEQRGLATGGAFGMPLTQEYIADALGLSVVHVNRTLQQMRRENVLEFSRGQVRILDIAEFEQVSEFQPPLHGGAS
jgi:CRP-like cAMP-binding protein